VPKEQASAVTPARHDAELALDAGPVVLRELDGLLGDAEVLLERQARAVDHRGVEADLEASLDVVDRLAVVHVDDQRGRGPLGELEHGRADVLDRVDRLVHLGVLKDQRDLVLLGHRDRRGQHLERGRVHRGDAARVRLAVLERFLQGDEHVDSSFVVVVVGQVDAARPGGRPRLSSSLPPSPPGHVARSTDGPTPARRSAPARGATPEPPAGGEISPPEAAPRPGPADLE
jgi:hypothetical protein